MAIKKDYHLSIMNGRTSPISEKMVGVKFGKLLVIKFIGVNKGNGKGAPTPIVLAQCECGSLHNYISAYLRQGRTKSCGCFQAENSRRIHTKHGQKSTIHGKRGTIIYARWRSMFDRVRSDHHYANVKIADRWKGENGFINFVNDMGEMPTPKHTVDRYPIMNGNYEPGNTRWATSKEQMQNIKRNVNRAYNGELLCLSEISRRANVDRRRLNELVSENGMDIYVAIDYINKTKRNK